MSELRPGHVLIVFLVSLLTGVILGVAAWVIGGLVGLVRPWLYGIGVFAIVTAASWLILVRWSLRAIEAVLDIDLDRDGYIGDAVEPRIIIMDESDRGRTEGLILHDLPGGESKFARLSAGVLHEDVPLAERFWVGSRGPYSLTEFRDLRDYLLLRGLLSWQSDHDHRQGVEILPPGRALMRHYAEVLDHFSPTKGGDLYK